ncbi:MAG TPA: alpha/beta hydrolase [Solirubrobacteraceae bacterium]|nr:alpha/beta hydrolase [Solirubrobacteraceae bacterium]
MRRLAPNWSGAAREQTLADAKECFSDPRVLDAALGYYRDTSPGAGLQNLTTPALVAGGTTDIIHREAFERSGEAFDGECEVMIAEGAGHWPHREQQSQFEQRLLGFLARAP